MAHEPRDVLKEYGESGAGGSSLERNWYEPSKKTNSLLCKGPEQLLTRAIPVYPEPGPGAALPRPLLKNKTDPAFRCFCIKAGRMRYSGA